MKKIHFKITLMCIFLIAGSLIIFTQTPEKVYRLSIRYYEGKFTMLKCEELNKVLSPVLKERILTKEDEKAQDFYFEILDGKEKILLRSTMNDPTVSLMEYPDPDDPTKIRSSLVKHDDVTFSMLVPAPPDGKKIRFLHLPSEQAGVKTAAGPEELGTFDLKIIVQ